MNVRIFLQQQLMISPFSESSEETDLNVGILVHN